MEARARAAVAKLQEVSQQVTSGDRAPAPSPTASDERRRDDQPHAAARPAHRRHHRRRGQHRGRGDHRRRPATRPTDGHRQRARRWPTSCSTRPALEARRAAEAERIKAENEVQALLARRDFLLADVDHLEQYLGAQRERLRDAAVQLQDLVERVPGGLGEMRRPLLSASAEPLPATSPPAPEPASPPAAGAEPDGDVDDQPLHAELDADDRPATTHDSRIDATPIADDGRRRRPRAPTTATRPTMRLDLDELDADGDDASWSASRRRPAASTATNSSDRHGRRRCG